MNRYGYCLKKGEIINDRKLGGYCLSAGNFETICKNLAILKDNGTKKIIPIKLSE